MPSPPGTGGAVQSSGVCIRWNPGDRCGRTPNTPSRRCQQCRGSTGCREPLRAALCGRFRSYPEWQDHKNPQQLDRANWGRLAVADELLCTIRGRFVMSGIEMLAVVALVKDLPDEGLVRGQVGTVVESWAPDVYEVEFSDGNGKAYAMVALSADQLMRLHHEPVHQAA